MDTGSIVTIVLFVIGGLVAFAVKLPKIFDEYWIPLTAIPVAIILSLMTYFYGYEAGTERTTELFTEYVAPQCSDCNLNVFTPPQHEHAIPILNMVLFSYVFLMIILLKLSNRVQQHLKEEKKNNKIDGGTF
nr:hypothetical protein 2 [Gammaproteobacteria bacterium]